MANRQEIISIDRIYKTYEVGTQQVNALAGVDLKIWRNDYVAIMGPSGSGKSTLMNILGCLDTPTSGQYVLNGTDVSHMDEEAFRKTDRLPVAGASPSYQITQTR